MGGKGQDSRRLDSIRVDDYLRGLSSELFNKDYLLETALAIASEEEDFETDLVLERVRERAAAAELSRPSRAPIHDCLKRLHRLLALDCTPPPPKPRGQAYKWSVRREGSFWGLLAELGAADSVADERPEGRSPHGAGGRTQR